MANRKDNIKYATSFIGFDETSGNVYDSIGGYVGTVYNSPARVAGWNNKGYAMSFNGSNQFVQFNSKIINQSVFSIRFKIKSSTFAESNFPTIIDTRGNGSNANGLIICKYLGYILIQYFENGVGVINARTDILEINKWHDIFVSLDTVKKEMKVIANGRIQTFILDRSSLKIDNNLTIGRYSNASSHFGSFTIDQLEIYDRVISIVPDKYLVLHDGRYKYHNGTSWHVTTGTEINFMIQGMNNLSHITEAQWAELTGDISIAVWSDFEDKQYVSAVLEKESFTAKDLLHDAELVYYTEEKTEELLIETTIDPITMDAVIGDNPHMEVYTKEDVAEKMLYTTGANSELGWTTIGDAPAKPIMFERYGMTKTDTILQYLDELETDTPKLLSYELTDEQRYLFLRAAPKDVLMVPLRDIDLTNVYSIDYFKIDSIIIGMGDIKIIVSFDSGTTWLTYHAGVWEEVLLDVVEVKRRGMNVTTLNAISRFEWDRGWQNSPTIRFAFLLSIEESVDKASIDALLSQIDLQGRWKHSRNADWEYISNDFLNVYLTKDGDYKIIY